MLFSTWINAFIINFVLIFIVRSLPILTPSGWFNAGILGTILLASLGLRGWIAVVFYLIFGSLITRLGFIQKKQMGISEARGGRRGPENLWGSAGVGAFLALLINTELLPKDLLIIGFCASFASKLADTFGSEVGKLWGKKAYLITDWSSVPPGTDGAISLEGTIASFVGSLIMTLTMLLISLIPNFTSAIIVLSSGFLATLLESFIGALFQNRYVILTNEVVNSLQTLAAAFLAISFAYLFT